MKHLPQKKQITAFALALLALPATALLTACESNERYGFQTQAEPVINDDAARKSRMLEMYAEYKRESFPNVADISVEQVRNRSNVVFVDVREAREQSVSMIPGAITKAEFNANRDQYRSKLVVPYCTIGYRSGIFTRSLQNQGFEARNLIGSVLAWAHAGESFATASGPTKRVHVYGREWDLLPADYESTW